MKTQNKPDGKRMNHDIRGQKGSVEIRYPTPVIDLNWQKMNERRDDCGRYSPNINLNLMPPVLEGARGVDCGPIQGYQIIVRVGKYYF